MKTKFLACLSREILTLGLILAAARLTAYEQPSHAWIAMQAFFKLYSQPPAGPIDNTALILQSSLGFNEDFLRYYNDNNPSNPPYLEDTPFSVPVLAYALAPLYTLQSGNAANDGVSITEGVMEEDDLDVDLSTVALVAKDLLTQTYYDTSLLPPRPFPYDAEFRVLQHFWFPDNNGCDNLSATMAIDPTQAPMSSLQKAQILWTNALNSYWTNRPRSAWYLGRVAHLLEDAASPAHVNLDPHLPGVFDFGAVLDGDGGDSYEQWVLFQDNHTNINWHSPGTAIPDYTTLQPPLYLDTLPSCWDLSLTRLFFNMASASRSFDSDDSGHRDPTTFYNVPESKGDKNTYNMFEDRIDLGVPPSLFNEKVLLHVFLIKNDTPTLLNEGVDFEYDQSEAGSDIYLYPQFAATLTPDESFDVEFVDPVYSPYNGIYSQEEIESSSSLEGRFSIIPSSVLYRHHQPALESMAIGYTAALFDLYVRRTYDWVAAAQFQVDASGGTPDSGDGGKGGTVDIRTGVEVDTGDGSGGELTADATLTGGFYSYLQVPPDANVNLTISGTVFIYCQHVFAPATITAMPGSTLYVYAGDAVWLWSDGRRYGWPHGVAGATDPSSDPTDAPTVVDFSADNSSGNDTFDGGKFIFWTTQTGPILADVSVDGGDSSSDDGASGGAGGTINLAALYYGPINEGLSANGGNAIGSGGNGGDGGNICFAGGMASTVGITANGGDGSSGDDGLTDTTSGPPDPGSDGAKGEDGGWGGNGGGLLFFLPGTPDASFDFVFDSLGPPISVPLLMPNSSVTVLGGQGADGGDGESGFAGAEGTPINLDGGDGGTGGDGGVGGDGGSPGFVEYESPDGSGSIDFVDVDGGNPGDGGDGGDGAVGGNGYGNGDGGKGGSGGKGGKGGNGLMAGNGGDGGSLALGGDHGPDGGDDGHDGDDGNDGDDGQSVAYATEADPTFEDAPALAQCAAECQPTVLPTGPPTSGSSSVTYTISTGGTAIIGLSAAGERPMSFQWMKDGQVITNATNSLFFVVGQTNTSGDYSVIVSNALGSITVSNFIVQVELIPVIPTAPLDQSVPAGGKAAFTATAYGQGPLYYHWFMNHSNLVDGPNVAGSSTPTLELFNLTANLSGSDVSLEVSNSLGMAKSLSALLTVVVMPPPSGSASIIAGISGTKGASNGPGASATFNEPSGITVDASGNIYVADSFNALIRKITPALVVSTIAGQLGSFGDVDGTNFSAQFNHPHGMTLDNSSGEIFLTDSSASTVREMNPNGTNWDIVTIAGLPEQAGQNAPMNEPGGIACQGSNTLYLANSDDQTILRLNRKGSVWSSVVIAGTSGLHGYADGTNGAALFNYPEGVAVDAGSNVYVADTYNQAIRKIAPIGTNYVVTTLAGAPTASGKSDGTGEAARFYYPFGIAVDNAGNLFVADTFNSALRKVTPEGVVTTLATNFFDPEGIAVDGAGNVYLACLDSTIVKWTPSTATLPALPALGGALQPDAMVLSWPSSYASYVVESTTVLGPEANWVPVTNATQVSNGQNVVTLPQSHKLQFFRLRKIN